MANKRQKGLIVLFLSLILIFNFCVTTAIAEQERPMMFKYHRQAQVLATKTAEAFQFAKEITQYVRNKHPQTNIKVYQEVFGDVGVIHWFSEFPDLATHESHIRALFADPGYMAILAKAAGLFIEGSVHDTLMVMIP